MDILEKVSESKFFTFIRNRLTTTLTLFIVMMAMWATLAFTTENFLTYRNLFNLARQTSVIGVVAIGMTFVIISAGIDLSVGSIVGASGIMVSLLMVNGVPVLPAIFLTLLATMAMGAISAMFIFEGNVPPFIATLGMMQMARGLSLWLSGGQIITGLPSSFLSYAQMEIFGLPMLFVTLIVIAAISHFVLTSTRFGRSIFTIGSSDEVARLSGINMRLNYYTIYMINAVLAGIAGIMLTSRLSSGIPTSGTGYELDAIAASVIGGASLTGAEGSVIGTIIGALIMATLRNGGNLLGINPFWLRMATGLLIVIAVLIDQMSGD